MSDIEPGGDDLEARSEPTMAAEPDTLEGQVDRGHYSDLYYGDPSINGHVDAPHAQAITKPEIGQLVYTGRFQISRGRTAAPARNTIYANAKLRRMILSTPNWQDTPRSGTVEIRGTQYTVKPARRAPGEDKHKPLIVRESDKDRIVQFIKDKAPSDARTGNIAHGYVQRNGTAVVTKVNRHICDINRDTTHKPALGHLDPSAQNDGVREYRAMKANALAHTNTADEAGEASTPYLHIALHGKKNRKDGHRRDCDIEIGTVNGQSCDIEIRDWFAKRLREELASRGIKIDGRAVDIKKDVRLSGDATKVMGPRVHGPNYKTIQLEICRDLRFNHTEELADIMRVLLEDFTRTFAGKEDQADAVAGGTSDTAADVGETIEPTDVAEVPSYNLKVRYASKEMVRKGAIGISPQLASRIGTGDGGFVSIFSGDGRAVELIGVVVKNGLDDDSIMMSKRLRETFGTEPGASIELSIYDYD